MVDKLNVNIDENLTMDTPELKMQNIINIISCPITKQIFI
jgi:hypothetical protein